MTTSTEKSPPALVDWLRQQLDEDERIARAAEHPDGPSTLHWRTGGQRHHRFDNGCTENYAAVFTGQWDRILIKRDMLIDEVSPHIAAWDPARVLAEIAAKRATLDFYTNTLEIWEAVNNRLEGAFRAGTERSPQDERDCSTFRTQVSVLGDVLQDMAQPYQGRPGWREEWTA